MRSLDPGLRRDDDGFDDKGAGEVAIGKENRRCVHHAFGLAPNCLMGTLRFAHPTLAFIRSERETHRPVGRLSQ